jgi:hypothetical protein
MSLAEIQEAPDRGLILVAGPPGAGKSTFCHQVVLNSLAADRPVIFVTTERSASDIVSLLRERGLGETIRIRQNCETFGLATGEPSCFFTIGFLNGLFSAVKSQHVREVKCIAMGDPYCEWEII